MSSLEKEQMLKSRVKHIFQFRVKHIYPSGCIEKQIKKYTLYPTSIVIVIVTIWQNKKKSKNGCSVK